MNWRHVLKARWFYALLIGAAVVALAIRYDGVWIWGLGVILVGCVLLTVEWLFSLTKPTSRRSSPFRD